MSFVLSIGGTLIDDTLVFCDQGEKRGLSRTLEAMHVDGGVVVIPRRRIKLIHMHAQRNLIKTLGIP